MAREINAELLDTKIEKAQKNLVKAKHRYDAAAATLKDLLDKRDALRQKKLLDAIAQSGRMVSPTGNLQLLPQGIYIQNGKKIIK